MSNKEYWNLIGREPFLVLKWEPKFSHACSFCRMLMNHKNFHFTQIPDKTNDVIFLKRPKTMFLGHFWPLSVIFAQWGLFPKNLALSHITRYEPILWKLTDRWTDGRTDGWKDRRMDGPYFIGPFWPRPGVQQNCEIYQDLFFKEIYQFMIVKQFRKKFAQKHI